MVKGEKKRMGTAPIFPSSFHLITSFCIFWGIDERHSKRNDYIAMK